MAAKKRINLSVGGLGMNRLAKALEQVRSDPQLARRQLNDPSPMRPLSQYISTSQTASIPDEVCELAKRHILDTLASIVACSQLKPARLARDFALFNGGQADTAHLLGTNLKTTLLDAIFANALTTHGAEINDFCPSAFVQPGPPVISTVMGIGEAFVVSGEQLLRAVIVGYEISCRLPKALGIRNLQDFGLSSHGVGPTFGSAAAAASLLKIPQDRIGDMFGYCVQQASGSYEWLRDTEHLEKAFLFSGMPARDGAYAALLVHHGFTGVSDPFEGNPGWLVSCMFLGSDSDLDKQKLVHKLGEEFELPLVAYKRYPVGGPLQPGVEGLLTLIKMVNRDDIVKVDIKMPGSRVNSFSNTEMPALNLRYLSAVILEDGELTFEMAASHERMATDSIRQRMETITLSHDPEQEKEPRVESAIVEVTLRSGEQKQIFIEHVLGFPQYPMNRNHVHSKAMDLLVPVLGNEQSEALVDLVWNLEKVDDIREIIPLMIIRR
jgi:2-methylcitrate dehydratase PrpD